MDFNKMRLHFRRIYTQKHSKENVMNVVLQATTQTQPRTKRFILSSWEKSCERFCNWDDTHWLIPAGFDQR